MKKLTLTAVTLVSVPLRGKEGAGPIHREFWVLSPIHGEFPSPCGVRRVRDLGVTFYLTTVVSGFPSPCGVRRVRDKISVLFPKKIAVFPSPCGVRRVRDIALGLG